MNAELQETMLRYLNGLEARLSRVEDFASDQVPLLVQEWLRWEFWSNIIKMSGWAMLALLLVLLFRWCVKEYKAAKDDETRNASCFFGTVFFAGSVLSVIPVLVYAYSATKVIIAPRVVIVENVAETLKGHRR